MKRFIWTLVFVAAAMPAFGQALDDQDASTQIIGAQFAMGNLAVRELVAPVGPVEQLRTFFADARFPLTKDQEQRLNAIVSTQQSDGRLGTSDATDEVRRLNQEYFKQLDAVLTPEQQNAWRHYRVEQIRLRGGFPALKQMLEHGGVELSSEQENSIQRIFENFAARHVRLAESNPNAGIADVDRLVLAEFNRVVALLTPDQRNLLQTSRRRNAIASNAR